MIWFFLKVIILFAVLAWPWHVIAPVSWAWARLHAVRSVPDSRVDDYAPLAAAAEHRTKATYSLAFAKAGNWCLERLRWESQVTRNGRRLKGLLGSTGFALFVSEYSKEPAQQTDLGRDIEVGVVNFKQEWRPGLEYRRRTDSRMTGYVPTATFVALLLATPMRLWRRLWTLPIGLLAIHAFIGLRLALALASFFNGDAAYCLYKLGPWSAWILEMCFRVTATAPATTYLVPLTVWMALCVRMDTIEALVRRRSRCA